MSTISAPIRPLRISTLVGVELRKMTDTRTSRTLLATIGALVFGVLVWKVTHPDVPRTFANYAGASTVMVGYAGPILALLAMSSEWTQRTALTTFTLAPRRLPVLVSKLVTAVILTTALIVVALALSAAAVAVTGVAHGGESFADLGMEVRGAFTFVLLHTLLGAAFGAVLGHSTVALGAYFLAPIVWGNVANELFKGAAPWLDIFATYERLSSPDALQDVPQTLTSISVWVLVPLAVGIARFLRREVS
jgi:ABC-type transport system involved in multi-copper enzyme maturation permease subunit